jgi:hypothetical protein
VYATISSFGGVDPSEHIGAYDIGGWRAAAGDGFFTVPSGVSMVRAAASLQVSGQPVDTVLYASLLVNSVDMPNAYAKYLSSDSAIFATIDKRINLYLPPTKVSAGDTLKVYLKISSGSGCSTEGSSSTLIANWFSVEAVELAADDS